MADTVRTRAQILALLADNNAGDISPQDMRDAIVTLHGVYGGLRISNNVTTQTVVLNTPEIIENWAAVGVNRGVTEDATNRDLEPAVAGVFKASLNAQCSSDTNNTTATFHLYINGAPAGYQISNSLKNAGDSKVFPMEALISLSGGDLVQGYVEADKSVDLTIRNAQLNIIRIA